MSSPGFLSDEQRKLMRSLSHGRDIMPEGKKFVRTVSHGQHAMPELAGSPEKHEKSGVKLVSVGSAEVKRDRHSHSGKNGRPKKGDFLVVGPFLPFPVCYDSPFLYPLNNTGTYTVSFVLSVAQFCLLLFPSLILFPNA